MRSYTQWKAGVCPECGTTELGEVRVYEEVHGLDDGVVHDRYRVGYGSPRYMCSRGHEFVKLATPDSETDE